MAKNNLINVFCFGKEVGRLGFDEDLQKSYFQYHPDFLRSNLFLNLFPDTGVIKRVAQTQVFSKFNNETFRGLPPMFADSLPDVFGNIIFKKWLEASNKNLSQISVIEQLAYVANRGMGAIEYHPCKALPNTSAIDIAEILDVLKQVLSQKEITAFSDLSSEALLNIFKVGSSAGGARPKILISENIKSGEIIPGDVSFSPDYHHYLVKLSLDEEFGYNREVMEYCYYLTATRLGIIPFINNI